ncbi:MAG: nucleotidyltransferase domain-containing protein [Armatimonadetes bacterium]|nr:nucleotidyltransferase domain-containing protein [Armatimonadota bacterium]
MSSDRLDAQKLRGILRDYPYIAAAYLFGSQVSGKTSHTSDTDIAILLDDNAPTGRQLVHEEDYLAYRIAKALEIKKVDLMDLNGQGLVFQHTILRTGILIYEADPAVRIPFVAKVISYFCDFEPTLRLMERYRIEGLLERCGKQ